MANFIITEEQYRHIMESGNDGKLQVHAEDYPGSNVSQKVQNAEMAMDRAGVTNKTNVNINANAGNSDSNTANEGRVFTKKEIDERKLRFLKENSKVFTVKNFLRR